MKAHVITIEGNDISENSARVCIESSQKVNNEFDIFKFNAFVPDDVDEVMKRNKLKWSYPWQGSILDMSSGLRLSAYETANPKKRVACFLSHYMLWKKCAETNEPLIVLEHDALFTQKLDIDMISVSKYNIIGLNDPRGATRRSQLYHEIVQKGHGDIVPVPKIDDNQVPQGLPGNSAYFIKPAGANKLLDATRSYGAWPNDALMCKQLLPNQLGMVRKYCTKVQGTQSTTTL